MNDLRSLGSNSYRIIALALITGLIHLYVGIADGFAILILNGLGFIALVVGLYLLPQLAGWNTHIRWTLVAYTAVTIIGYFFIVPQPLNYALGLVTKAVEVLLIVLLFLKSR